MPHPLVLKGLGHALLMITHWGLLLYFQNITGPGRIGDQCLMNPCEGPLTCLQRGPSVFGVCSKLPGNIFQYWNVFFSTIDSSNEIHP